jgi:hypothetical protein
MRPICFLKKWAGWAQSASKRVVVPFGVGLCRAKFDFGNHFSVTGFQSPVFQEGIATHVRS